VRHEVEVTHPSDARGVTRASAGVPEVTNTATGGKSLDSLLT
jgi:hypothetical protein